MGLLFSFFSYYDSEWMDYYEILQVSRDATTEEIKNSFRKLARKYHPDLHPNNPVAQEQFREIYQAYKVLCDPIQRRQYNQNFDSEGSFPQNQEYSPQYFYIQGIEKALKQDYEEAVECYSQAIALNPNFVEAYLKRIEARYHLGDNRGVLEDCQQALQINPHLAYAYYYRGRVRYRLGSSQSAIEAYTQAINLANDYAQAYYHRGLAFHDLKAHPQAMDDWQLAAQWFKTQEDWSGYRLVQDTLEALSGSKRLKKKLFLVQWVMGIFSVCSDVAVTMVKLIFDPVEGLLMIFEAFEPHQAMIVGIMLGVIADLNFVMGFYYGWQLTVPNSYLKLAFIGLVIFVTVVMINLFSRLLIGRSRNWQGDIFLAGATVLPSSLLALVSALVVSISFNLLIVLAVFAGCATILILYKGYTRIAYLSERAASMLIPLIILLSGWLSYFLFKVMFP